jgi:hypothetical protein
MNKFNRTFKKYIKEEYEGVDVDANYVAEEINKVYSLLNTLSDIITPEILNWCKQNQDSNEDAVRILNLADDLHEHSRIFAKRLRLS